MTKSFVLLRPQFLVDKGELQMKAPRDGKTSNIYKERDDVLYFNEKERRCTARYSSIYFWMFIECTIHMIIKNGGLKYEKNVPNFFAPLAISYCTIFPFFTQHCIA